MNRVAVIGVIFLFVASSVIPISGFNLEQSSISTTSSNMLYVGGSGDGNYSTIKDAINNSNDGDTIYVYSNTYYECDIKVDKSITLVGEDKNTTIIDGDKTYKKHVLILEKDAISINGFTVQRCGHSRSGILVNSDNNIISNCNFFYNDPVSGIIISEQHNNVITNCYFENNHFGIDLYGWDDVARENVISNCIFRPNNDLKVDKTQNTVIDNCTFDDSGLRVKLDCNGLTVTDCQFYEKFGYIYRFFWRRYSD